MHPSIVKPVLYARATKLCQSGNILGKILEFLRSKRRRGAVRINSDVLSSLNPLASSLFDTFRINQIGFELLSLKMALFLSMNNVRCSILSFISSHLPPPPSSYSPSSSCFSKY